MNSIIGEFISALEAEIEDLKKGKGNNVTEVTDGVLIQETASSFIYKFTLDNLITIMDDTPAQIEVNGVDYDCNVVTVQDQFITLSLDKNIGTNIAFAKLKTNLWYLLEILKRRFEESKNDLGKFDTSLEVFRGISKDLPNYLEKEFQDDEINSSQKTAVREALNKSFSIIWGPPGTGKTEVIARIVEANIDFGRKTLLVSHANNAVDEALIKVARHLKNSHIYKEGKLVRFGTMKEDILRKIQEENLSMVIFDEIVQEKSKDLNSKKEKLLQELNLNERKLNLIVQTIKELEEIDQKINDVKVEINEIEKNIEENHKVIEKLKLRYLDLHDKKERLERKLNESLKNSRIKNFFLGLNPDKIKDEIKDLTTSIIYVSADILKTDSNIAENEKDLQQNQRKLESLEKEKSSKLKLAGFSYSINLNIEMQKLKNSIAVLEEKIKDIEKEIEAIQDSILSEAMLVATTLTKTYLARQLDPLKFDCLIVDEVSMAPQPMLFWAISKATTNVVLVGDFLQLPPISTSEDEIAKKWLGSSIFDTLHINTIDTAKKDKRVTLLDRQYRMHPEISVIPRLFIYEGVIEDAKTNFRTIYDSFSDREPLVLVDTYAENPWVSQVQTGGRFNLYHAILSITVAEKIISLNDSLKISLITPYRHQARIMLKVAEDKGLQNKLRINVVHSFQGAEDDIVIFDTVESFGAKKWSMLSTRDLPGEAHKLINVAFTRARSKFYLIANTAYLKKNLPEDDLILNIIRYIEDNGFVVNSNDILETWQVSGFLDKYLYDENLKDSVARNKIDGILNEHEFWPLFLKDLVNASEKVLIISPFITETRVAKLFNHFYSLVSRGIKLFIITRPPSEQIDFENASKVIEKLSDVGMYVVFRNKIHEKIAIIDDEIVWHGSLNILSHRDTSEAMSRFVGRNTAIEVYNKLNLDIETLLIQSENICPKCSEKGIISKLILKHGKYGFFYVCSNPNCDFKIDAKKINGGSYKKWGS
ncbi:MAG: AAA domain-containing protein [archaeon]